MELRIPEYLGEVIPYECRGSDRIVAVVSRAYSPVFERATADVLKYLTEEFGIRLVFAEGHFPISDADITDIEDPDLHRKSSDIFRWVQDSNGPLRKIVDYVKKMTPKEIKDKAVPVSDFDEMLSEIRHYNDGTITVEPYFLYLERMAEETGVDLKTDYPYFYMNPWCQRRQRNAFMDLFMDSLRNAGTDMEKVNKPKLNHNQAVIKFVSSGEAWRLVQDIRMRLCRFEYPRTLVEADGNIELMRRMVDMEGTPELVNQLKQNREKFSSEYFSRTLSDHGIKPPEGMDIIDILLTEMERFYELAFQRASHYAEQIDNHMNREGKTASIALISGFCTDNVIGLLADKGISSCNIIPIASAENIRKFLIEKQPIYIAKIICRPYRVDGPVQPKMTDEEKTEYIGKLPKPHIDPHVLTDKEREVFEGMLRDMAPGFIPIEHGPKGAYKGVIKLRRGEPLGLLALKIADTDIEKLNPRARVYLEKRLKQGGYNSFVELLEAEAARAKKLNKLESRNISKLLRSGLCGDFFFFLEEYAERTLKDYVEKNHPLNPSTVIYIAKELANGLGWIHRCECGMYHGDLKPENILFRNGIIAITDFGLTSSLPDEHGLGIFNETAAPEIIMENQHTPQSDIWSYGACVYFTKTRSFPFPPNCPETKLKGMTYEERKDWTIENIYKAIMDDQKYDGLMKKIDIEFDPREFRNMAKVLKKCLARDPKKRFADGWELGTELLDSDPSILPEAVGDMWGEFD